MQILNKNKKKKPNRPPKQKVIKPSVDVDSGLSKMLGGDKE